MKLVSLKNYLDSIANGLGCCIFVFNENTMISKSIDYKLDKLLFSYKLFENNTLDMFNRAHISIDEEELELNNRLIYIEKIIVPVRHFKKSKTLVWVFAKERDITQSSHNKIQIVSEDMLSLVQTLSEVYTLLSDLEGVRKENSLYRQMTYHISNMLSNSLILYDSFDNILFYNNSAKQMEITNRNIEEILDLTTKEIYLGNEIIGKVRYTSNQNDLISQYSNTIKNFNKIIGKNAQMDKVLYIMKQVAPTDTTVLLRGESGTGKEEYAKLIHNLSTRKSEPFVALNCAAIPENLLESELFGYEGGSFTGAKKEGKVGKFLLANKGTLLLDEIGDMPLSLQVKLLRVLQERYIEPVGGNKKIPIDVRIICATHQNLEEKKRLGEFREDLFYRINVIPITIPSLDSRKDDIELLVTYYVKKYCISQKKGFMTFSYESMKALKEYSWPGNIRELINVVEYCVTMINKSTIDINDLPAYLQLNQAIEKERVISKDYNMFNKKHNKPSKEELLILLNKFGNSTDDKKRLAEHLNISLATLYRWISKLK